MLSRQYSRQTKKTKAPVLPEAFIFKWCGREDLNLHESPHWMYFVGIIDWYSRKIVGYELSQSMNKEFVIKAVNDAIKKHGAPLILNSDQGSQFTSPVYVDTLKEHGIKISMDGKGRALDNAITERFWRTLKWEDIYIMQYETPHKLRQGIDRYIRYYNYEREHQSLDGQKPADLYYSDFHFSQQSA